MSIKLALLKSGETVVSDIKEILNAEQKVRAYILNKPHVIQAKHQMFLAEGQEPEDREIQITLSPWIILTEDEDMVIPIDWVVTIVEPIASVKTVYEEKINGQDS